jgi:hypothetical protein
MATKSAVIVVWAEAVAETVHHYRDLLLGPHMLPEHDTRSRSKIKID